MAWFSSSFVETGSHPFRVHWNFSKSWISHQSVVEITACRLEVCGELCLLSQRADCIMWLRRPRLECLDSTSFPAQHQHHTCNWWQPYHLPGTRGTQWLSNVKAIKFYHIDDISTSCCAFSLLNIWERECYLSNRVKNEVDQRERPVVQPWGTGLMLIRFDIGKEWTLIQRYIPSTDGTNHLDVD